MLVGRSFPTQNSNSESQTIEAAVKAQVKQVTDGMLEEFMHLKNKLNDLEKKYEHSQQINISNIDNLQTELEFLTTSNFHLSDRNNSDSPNDDPDRSESPDVNHQLNALSSKVKSIQALCERFDAKLDRLDAKVDRNDIRSLNLENEVVNHEVNVNNSAHMVNDLKAQVQELEQKTEDIAKKVKVLEDNQMLTNDLPSDQKQNIRDEVKVIRERLEYAIEQSHVREANRVLRALGKWAHPVPTLNGRRSPEGIKAFAKGIWALNLPRMTKFLSKEEVDKWLTAYEIKDYEFMQHLNDGEKKAFLDHFIGGNTAIDYFC
ncbi:uncharacterized protein I206_101906 [Kwoniella pini CBS 10737]|uniref:Uncharacterized protein n=1 Tax=Kwoniella pini CBS 10737 TaxID=1296096 RepID=A0A1B9HVD4_9TREE|nr:uncharacterized protein I206_07004 [Kwoniella pini CBS 10737]OCF47226.1 hypothetical protein I206_07004 [Kwoniella pini CBS 10737]